ncbi:ribosome silencing factor [Phaeospirillum tilakii]|uniref:Ribosomal silencing factor RsfS n=1 Tax=Phaeospirillum tilakii TaxID=741673 RepID=A0ABW5CEA0_9PROT
MPWRPPGPPHGSICRSDATPPPPPPCARRGAFPDPAQPQEPAISQPLRSVSPEETSPAPLLALITAALEDLKAEDIVTFDLRGRTALADGMVIASGRSARQVGAMADRVERALRQAGQPVSVEGLPQADWVLVDGGDVIVHLFRPEVRTFYNLEKIWARPEPVAPEA